MNRSKILVGALFVLLFGFRAMASHINVFVYPCLLVRGEACNITWRSIGAMADHVNVSVWLGHTLIAEFPNLANQSWPLENSYSWTVPADLANGVYTFRVRTTDNLVWGQSRYPVNERRLVIEQVSPLYAPLIGDSMTISWHGFGLGLSPAVDIVLYRGGMRVGLIGQSDMSHSSGCGRTFHWRVGHLWDPSTFGPGPDVVPTGYGYRIRVMDFTGAYWDESDSFSIDASAYPDWFKSYADLIREIHVVQAAPIPVGCPRCVELQLPLLVWVLERSPQPLEAVLYRVGRRVAVLGRSGPKGKLNPKRLVDLGDSFAWLVKENAKFELRFFKVKGKLVYAQPVTLRLKR